MSNMDPETAKVFIEEANIISMTLKSGEIQLHDTMRCAAETLNISHSSISKCFKTNDVCVINSRVNGKIVLRKLYNND